MLRDPVTQFHHMHQTARYSCSSDSVTVYTCVHSHTVMCCHDNMTFSIPTYPLTLNIYNHCTQTQQMSEQPQ